MAYSSLTSSFAGIAIMITIHVNGMHVVLIDSRKHRKCPIAFDITVILFFLASILEKEETAQKY